MRRAVMTLSVVAWVVGLPAAESAAQPSLLPPLVPAASGIAAPKLGGYVQARETWEHKVGLTSTLNRARLSADGSLPNRFSYRVMAEFESGGSTRTAASVALRDAYLRWTRGTVALQAGQFKTPFSRAYVTSLTVIETVDRATVVDTLASKRDIGVMAEAAPIPEASASFGLFNGEGQNLPANRDSTTLIVARVVLRPFQQIQLGGSGARYGSDSTRYGLEASLEQHGALVRGEWIGQHRHGRSGNDHGWFALAGLRVFPWMQAVAMQEDLVRPVLGVGGRIRATTVGANFDLGASRTRLTVEYVARRAGVAQISRRTGIAQLQVRF